MRVKASLFIALFLLAAAPARAADVHLDAQDRTGTATLSKLADGNWRVAFPGGTLTVDAATATAWGEQLNPTPPPAACSNWLDDDGDGFRDFQDAGCTSADDQDEANAIPAPAGTEGLVRPFREFRSDMDQYLLDSLNDSVTTDNAVEADHQAFLKRFALARIWMGGSWPGDKVVAQSPRWFPPSIVYRDVMVATYTSSPTIADEFYLWDKPPSDPTRKRLYINFGTTQYAADLGNPNARARYINGVVAQARAADGVFVDDANFYLPKVVTNGVDGPDPGTELDFVRPWNPRTGAPMTDDEWAGYMLTTLKELKAQLPDAEVVMNTVAWHGPGILNIPQAKEALSVVDGWEIEGNTVGQDTLPYKPQSDYAHSVGAFIVHDIQATTLSRTYTEAAYLCMNAGQDFYGHPDMKPGVAWDSLWDKDLGAATSDCVKGGDGIYRRSFERGAVTVNPAARTATIG